MVNVMGMVTNGLVRVRNSLVMTVPVAWSVHAAAARIVFGSQRGRRGSVRRRRVVNGDVDSAGKRYRESALKSKRANSTRNGRNHPSDHACTDEVLIREDSHGGLHSNGGGISCATGLR